VADEERSRAEQESINSDYVLDQADRYFNTVRLKAAMERVEELLEVGKVVEAEAVLTKLSRVRLSSHSMVKVAEDWDAWRKAFDIDRQRPLVTYPGRLQNFLGDWLQRDTLIGFMAPDKTGKSVFLLDLAVRALRNRNRVAYFDVGDNSQDQVMRRLGSRVARQPGQENFRQQVKVPISIIKGEDGNYEVETKTRNFKRPVTVSAAFKAVQRLSRGVDRLRLAAYPNGTASVVALASELADWEREDGWVPDVIVIDYADILAAPPGVKDTLDQIDETWKQLRRLSQENHCLVVTATQASAAAYGDKATVLKKQHFSGRKTKLAHVNGMVGINVSVKDREAGVTKLNWVVRREGRYSEMDQVIVAGCWEWYDPAVRAAD
jgi:archaellum biogenesis ATPase FlaH